MIKTAIRILRVLLFPVSLWYGLVIIVRNTLYDLGVLKQYTSTVPVIAVGNLSVGGTGKSPVTAYIAGLLADTSRVAVLSRGYGRRTRGYLEIAPDSTVAAAGDEPLQLKKRMPALTVAVCEDRKTGIMNLEPQHDVIVLDDAFQHRAVKPGLNILLFEYAALGKLQFLLPAGNMREPFGSRKRADVLLVTKSPGILEHTDRRRILGILKPFPRQEVVFSYLEYGALVPVSGKSGFLLSEIDHAEELIVLTGIANPAPLINELARYTPNIDHHQFPDHHTFTKKNMIKLARVSAGKRIITTEKDAQRLLSPELGEFIAGLDIYYLPVVARIHADGINRFNTIISNYVNSANS